MEHRELKRIANDLNIRQTVARFNRNVDRILWSTRYRLDNSLVRSLHIFDQADEEILRLARRTNGIEPGE